MKPALVFLTAARLHVLAETHVTAAQDLAIEVLSPSTRRLDRKLKREIYERHGVRE